MNVIFEETVLINVIMYETSKCGRQCFNMRGHAVVYVAILYNIVILLYIKMCV